MKNVVITEALLLDKFSTYCIYIFIFHNICPPNLECKIHEGRDYPASFLLLLYTPSPIIVTLKIHFERMN